jgi:hypothetical protein
LCFSVDFRCWVHIRAALEMGGFVFECSCGVCVCALAMDPGAKVGSANWKVVRNRDGGAGGQGRASFW